MNADHIIRIILEARDNVSRVMQRVRSNLNNEVVRLRSSFSGLRKENDDLDKSFRRTFDAWQRHERRFATFRQRIFDLTQALRGMKKEFVEQARIDVDNQTRPRRTRQFLGSFIEGARESEQNRREIQRLISTEPGAVKQRRIELDVRERESGLALSREKFERKQILEFELRANAEKVRKEVEALQQAADGRSQKALDAVDNEIRKRNVALEEEIRKRRASADEDLNVLRKLRSETKDEEQLDLIRQEMNIVKSERDEDIRKFRNANREAIEEQKALRRTISGSTKSDLEDEIRRRKNAATDEARIKRFSLNEEFNRRHIERTEQIRKEREQLITPDRGTIIQRVFAGRREIDEADNAIQRFGRNSGRAFGDFFTGIQRGRKGLSDFSREGRQFETTMSRIGTTVGRAIGGLGTLVNLRWFLLVSALQLVGTLAIQLGAALVSLASSATLAGVALGTAFAGGLAQLAPILGILQAVTSRVNAVMDAVKLATKEQLTRGDDVAEQMKRQRTAAEALTDAQYALKRATEGVGEAQFNLAEAAQNVKDALERNQDAIRNLAEARKNAARQIVDANLEEKDAALSLQEAELGVLDAKRRLREEQERERDRTGQLEAARAAVREAQARFDFAKKQGDEAEISVARQQLGIAQQNLSAIEDQAAKVQNNIKEAEVAVKRAQINREQAEIRNKRSREEAKRVNAEGVEGNRQVIEARRALRDSVRAISQAEHQQVVATRAVAEAVHQVAISQRNLRDARQDEQAATEKQTAAQKNLQNALGDLSPAERRLFRSIRRFQEIYKKLFTPITDIIVSAISRAVDRGAQLLRDPKILGAARQLATAISKAVDSFSKFVLRPEIRRDIVFFISEAARNIPKVARGFENIFLALLRIARAGTPLFNDLLDKAVQFSDRLANFTNPVGQLTQKQIGPMSERTNVGLAQAPLDRLLETAQKHLQSWLRLAGAIARVLFYLGGGSAESGKGLVDTLTRLFNRIANFLRDNPEKVNEFFRRMRDDLTALGRTAGRVLPTLFKAFTSDEATAFSQFIIEVVIPGLTLMLQTIGFISKALLFFTKLPVIGFFATWGLKILVAEKALNRVFPVTQKLTNALKGLFAFAGRRLLSGLIETATLAQTEGLIGALIIKFPRLAAAARLLGVAMSFAFGPWGLAIAAIITAIYLLDRRFHFIRPTIEALGRAFRDVFDWIRTHWRLILTIITGPFGLIVRKAIEHRDALIRIFREIGQGIKDGFLAGWNAIADFFRGIAGWLNTHIIQPIKNFFRIGSPSKLMFEIGKDIVQGLVNAFLLLPKLLFNIFKQIPGLLKDALKGLPGIAVSAVKGAFGAAKGAAGKAAGTAKKGVDAAKDFLGGGGSALTGDVYKKYNPYAKRILDSKQMQEQHGKEIRRLRAENNNDFDVLIKLQEEGRITSERVKSELHKVHAPGFAEGGKVPGLIGQAVPIIAHAGEWVLNKVQQMKLAERIGVNVEQARAWIFGTNQPPEGPKAIERRRNFKPAQEEAPLLTPLFRLTPEEDPFGVKVWFVDFPDGSSGQVTERDAIRIKKTKGQWLPGYVSRSSHFNAPVPKGLDFNTPTFALGGVVGAINSMTTNTASRISTSSRNDKVEKHFNMPITVNNKEGKGDIDYLSRRMQMMVEAVG